MSTNTRERATPPGVIIGGPMAPGYDSLLTDDALDFLASLAREFEPRRQLLLGARGERQARLDAGEMPDFLPATREIRESDWTVAAIPADLQDRRVEITGPVDRKMVINALNSGARTFMADFEDSSSPTWPQMVEGQLNMRDAVRRDIDFTAPNGKHYSLNEQVATLLVRPRGWHLDEKHLLVDGEVMSGSLFDFGLYFFHNAAELLARGSGPYFYLPKLQSHLEARLWNDVFNFAQDALGIPRGSIRATVLIEHILAAFEMHEILWELREHSAGLNCGRWDYIFSMIKAFRAHPAFVLPDRAQIGMTVHFLSSYSRLVIQTCHRRGIHAIGGMAAQIPIKSDAEANERAIAKVRDDKLREVRNGHDGTWVAHPGLVPVAMAIFDEHMEGANQIANKRDDVTVTAADLLKVPEGSITMAGLLDNVGAALRYTEAWIGGQGCVPLNNLMEDAATAEISRTQLWQWVRYPEGRLEDGTDIDRGLVERLIEQEVAQIREESGDGFAARRFDAAAKVLIDLVTQDDLPEFLTTKAYELLD